MPPANRVHIAESTSTLGDTNTIPLDSLYPDNMASRIKNMHTTKPQSLTVIKKLFETKPLTSDKYGFFVQPDTGRRVTLQGINMDASSKLPKVPLTTSYSSPDDCQFWDKADDVSFVGRPFSLDEAREHFLRIKLWGYNTIRYIITWEAIEHKGPGIYDTEFLDYSTKILKIIEDIGGLYVFIDPHQDVWSRFTGGSGAPLWTLYAAGFEPRSFSYNQAAFLHNTYPDPANYPKMVWPSNYGRLAAQTMFTMFFLGKKYLPNCIIDGKNIQDYLQDHFINAIGFFMQYVKDNVPELLNTVVLGVETMNEPNAGHYAITDLNAIPPTMRLRVDTTPTPIQSMRLGMGIPQEVETWKITIFGPKKSGTRYIDPEGHLAWVTSDYADKKYGFTRDPNWKLGTCIFAQNGVWDTESGELLKPDFFENDPITGEKVDHSQFNDNEFVYHWSKFRERMRQVDSKMYLILQGLVMAIPPSLKGTSLIDERTISAIHYYDGASLMFKTWNRKFNVDTLGIVRGKYSNPIFGIVFGENNIRKSFRSQFAQLREDSAVSMGEEIPAIVTETGMPFDMDDKIAYKNNDYSSQESANDAIKYALETNSLNSTYWCYDHDNSHKWGDRWNLEDFSLFSKDDISSKLYFDSSSGVGKGSMQPSEYGTSAVGDIGEFDADTLNSLSITGTSGNNSKLKSLANTKIREIVYSEGETETDSEIDTGSVDKSLGDLMSGTRIAKAIIRPFPVLINGTVKFCEFSLKDTKFYLTIDTTDSGKLIKVKPGNKKEPIEPTIIFIPEIHFKAGSFGVDVDEGQTVLKHNAHTQYLEWFHEINCGEISMTVSNYPQADSDTESCNNLC